MQVARIGLWIGAMMVVCGMVGCGDGSSRQTSTPKPKTTTDSGTPTVATTSGPKMPAAKFGAPKDVAPGVRMREAVIQRPETTMRVWLYEPAKATGPLPLVIVPPAGSNLYSGMRLAAGDMAEHLPYVAAGFAVVSFDIDGADPGERASDAEMMHAVKQFRAAKAGYANAQDALTFVLANASIAKDRIYTAGHSSAGTLALIIAAQDKRIKGCVAFAPVTDVESRLRPVLPTLEEADKGYTSFIVSSSPKTLASKLTCPVLLFHSINDAVVSVDESKAFASQLQKTNRTVTLSTGSYGDHYTSMLKKGIPEAVIWLTKLDKPVTAKLPTPPTPQIPKR